MAASWKKLCVGCAGFGAIVFVLGIASIPVLHHIIKRQITENVVLKNGTASYEQWRAPSVPVYLQVYVFDLANPAEVLQGAKPFVQQKGPYTYQEHREKVDIVRNDNGTISYRDIKTYHFVREMSVGPDSDTFTTANMPLMSFVDGIRWMSEIPQELSTVLLAAAKEHLFIQRSVRDIVWGYKDRLLALGKDVAPQWFYTDFVGVLAGKNATDDGLYTVYTGESDISLLGVIDKYNGSRYVPFWTTPYANMVNGSDGTIGPPFIDRTFVSRMFSTDICRSIYGEYKEDVSTRQGIPLYRFTSPRAALANVTINPDNAGFCTPAGNCLGTGVLNISTCQVVDFFHIPIIVSFPHFYLADDDYINAVGGMHPDPIQHSTNIDIEPNSGLVLQVAKRLQINLYIQADKYVSETGNVRTMVYPILWINESAEVDDTLASRVKQELLLPLLLAQIAKYGTIALGGLIVAAAVTYIVHRERREKDHSQNTPSAANHANGVQQGCPSTNDITDNDRAHLVEAS